MSLSPNAERRAFSIWLRTGRRVIVRAPISIETKYNHWHDPQDGRFTYAGTGRHDGSWGGGGFTGGGGGDFRGGGASATEPWGPVTPRSAPRKRKPAANSASSKKPVASGTAVVLRDSSKPLRPIRRNGYTFYVDDADRTRDIQGTINPGNPSTRSRNEQRRAGQPDRRPTDDGGHYIAPRFSGPAEAFNHFAQDANFNRGAYRAIETLWGKATQAGKKVYVRISAFYQGQSRRPSQIVVTYVIDGDLKRRAFPNERQEKPNAKR